MPQPRERVQVIASANSAIAKTCKKETDWRTLQLFQKSIVVVRRHDETNIIFSFIYYILNASTVYLRLLEVALIGGGGQQGGGGGGGKKRVRGRGV